MNVDKGDGMCVLYGCEWINESGKQKGERKQENKAVTKDLKHHFVLHPTVISVSLCPLTAKIHFVQHFMLKEVNPKQIKNGNYQMSFWLGVCIKRSDEAHPMAMQAKFSVPRKLLLACCCSINEAPSINE